MADNVDLFLSKEMYEYMQDLDKETSIDYINTLKSAISAKLMYDTYVLAGFSEEMAYDLTKSTIIAICTENTK